MFNLTILCLNISSGVLVSIEVTGTVGYSFWHPEEAAGGSAKRQAHTEPCLLPSAVNY